MGRVMVHSKLPPLLFNSLMWIFQVTWQLKLSYARWFMALLITFNQELPTAVTQTLSVRQSKTLNLPFPKVAHERGYKPNSHLLGACCNQQAVIQKISNKISHSEDKWCCQIKCKGAPGCTSHSPIRRGLHTQASSVHLVQPLSDFVADRDIQIQPDAWCWILANQDLAGA